MIKLKTPHQTYSLPTIGQELTLGDFLNLQVWASGETHTTPSLVACLAGIDIDDALQVASKWEKKFDASSIVEALNSYPLIDAPKDINFQGQTLERKSFGYLNAGQRVALHGMNESIQLDKVLAICLAPQVYGKQWASHLDLFTEELRSLLAIDAIPLAYFFLGSGIVTRSNGLWLPFHLILILYRQKMADLKSMLFGVP